MRRGRFAEALAVINDSVNLLARFSPESPLRPFIQRQRALSQDMLALEEHLPDVLDGRVELQKEHRFFLVPLCRLHGKPHAAVRFYTQSLMLAPEMPRDSRNGVHYFAVTAAVLAGCGQAEADVALDELEKVRLRHLALQWLRDDLALWKRLSDHSDKAIREAVAARLRELRNDADLKGVRDQTDLAMLPEDEQEKWRSFWNGIAE
jgi:hypothetical protein